MSHPSRPQARGPAPRRRHQHKIEAIQALEDRLVMAPIVSSVVQTAVFTAATTPTNDFLGRVTIQDIARTTSPNPITSVTQFAQSSQFGGDIVRIKAGPGGDFGKGLYAISRGAGENINASNRAPGTAAPVNHPGAIYRLDPATGKASLFFDLNSVISQIEPGATSDNNISSSPAANSLGTASGLLNYYDIAFDPEGYFDGKPSMFVSTVDRADPNKNAVYQIGPDGNLIGVFAKFGGGTAPGFTANPTAILVPPVEQQAFLRGLFASNGTPGTSAFDQILSTGGGTITGGGTTSGTSTLSNSNFTAYFFDANAFRPGTNLTDATKLPIGVTGKFEFGPQVGLTAANTNYPSPIYSAFTDFGTAAAGGLPALPGLSGVEGLTGVVSNLLIAQNTTTAATGTTGGASQSLFRIFGNFLTTAEVTALTTQATATVPSGVDRASAVTTPFRRFQDIAFDQFGYFSSDAGTFGAAATAGTGTTTTATSADTLPYAGSLFVSDLATGLAVPVTPITPTGVTPAFPPIAVPIQGPGFIGVTLPTLTNGLLQPTPIVTGGNTTGGSNLGGRIIRIDPNGNVDVFATNFHTSGDQSSNSFLQSELSIAFSADGTTLYASDDDGIWQFKTVASLAGSTSGSIVGLNDLRTLGVPYDGQNSSVAVVDSGVDAANPSFRGKVSTGTNVLFNSGGNDDTAPGSVFSSATTGTGTGTGGAAATATVGFPDGHGTLLAGVVAQFVPQATIEPINIVSPNTITIGTTTGGTGGGTTTTSQNPSVTTSPQIVYKGLQYTAQHPFVADPVRPNKQDRVVAATLGFGTNRSFTSEVDAYKLYPQFTLAVKNQLHSLRASGITPIAAAGQFGFENNPNARRNGANGGGGTTTTTNAGLGDVKGMSLPAVLNEVISVTGTYPFPLVQNATSTPLNNFNGVVPRQNAPFLLGGLTTGLTGGGTTTTTAAATGSSITTLTADDVTIFKDKLLSSNNRNVTTDFAAPALDIPTFRRTVRNNSVNTASGSTSSVNVAPMNLPTDLVYQQAGTSLSAAITTGSFALVGSALDYWTKIAQTGGATVDAYLTTPVGVRSLNFGPNQLTNLSSYANPDGVNAILQWTAVPAVDDPNTFADALGVSSGTSTGGTGGTGGTTGAGSSGSPTVPSLFGTSANRSYSRISVSNAIAAIEGTEALNYLVKHDIFKIIDSDKSGLITAQKIQTFVDNSAAMGLPEAGAMARLLGGTARVPGQTNPLTGAGEQPDQPDVLQRRFNFFDYAANGRLAGVISVADLKLLSQKLLPQPDTFVAVDRQRSSQTNFLLAPTQPRASSQLQHIIPSAQFIPAARVARFRGVSPDAFQIGRHRGRTVNPFTTGPTFTLFAPTNPTGTPKAAAPAAPATPPAPASATTTPTPTQSAVITRPTAAAPVTPAAAPMATPAAAPPTTPIANPPVAQAIPQGQAQAQALPANFRVDAPNTTGAAPTPTFTPAVQNPNAPAGTPLPSPAGSLGAGKKHVNTRSTAPADAAGVTSSTPSTAAGAPASGATSTASTQPEVKKPSILQLWLQSRKGSTPTG